jgi:hypothetical protein
MERAKAQREAAASQEHRQPDAAQQQRDIAEIEARREVRHSVRSAAPVDEEA